METKALLPWRVTLNKHRATWSYFTRNPHDGGFGSTHCGARYVALRRALASVPAGAQYELFINGRDCGMQTKPEVSP